MISDVWGSCLTNWKKKVCYTWCQVPDFFCNYWKQLPISPASQKDFSETGWMEINQIWKKHIWISCKKWTVFFPTPHQPFCCVPEWGRWKNNEALFVGIVGCVVMRLGFFLVTWPLWQLGMIEHFGYVAAVSYPFGGIYIYIYRDIHIYDHIRYPSLGGFFLGG